jgi:hypothetical protein
MLVAVGYFWLLPCRFAMIAEVDRQLARSAAPSANPRARREPKPRGGPFIQLIGDITAAFRSLRRAANSRRGRALYPWSLRVKIT